MIHPDPSSASNEGLRLFRMALVTRTRAAVASLVGCDASTVGKIEREDRAPGAELRARIEASELAIPASAWSEPPKPEPVPAAPAAPEPSSATEAEAGGLSTLAQVDAQIARLIADANRSDWQPKDRLAAQREATSLAKHRARLRGEYAPSEAVLAKSPAWRSLRDDLLAALEKHPDALRDVIGILGRHGVQV